MAKRTVDINYLREILSYDAEVGVFRWAKPRQKVRVGDVAGTLRTDGYLVIRIDGVDFLGHRLAWAHHYGVWPGGFIDHRDRNPGNIRIANLREATLSQNNSNSRARAGLKGTKMERSGRWSARITVKGQIHHLGTFQTREEAHARYVQEAERVYGEFACAG